MSEKKTFTIDAIWTFPGYVNVKAENIEEACKLVESGLVSPHVGEIEIDRSKEDALEDYDVETHRSVVQTKFSDNPDDQEFDKQESAAIQRFLDLYCHDCPDKTWCGNCRLSDAWDYLHDMGYVSQD